MLFLLFLALLWVELNLPEFFVIHAWPLNLHVELRRSNFLGLLAPLRLGVRIIPL